MKNTPLLVLLVLGLGAAIGFGFFMREDAAGDGLPLTGDRTPAAPEAATDDSDTVTLADDRKTGASDLVGEPGAVASDRSTVATTLEVPAGAQVIRGQVVLPAGCAEDPTLDVFLLDEEYTYRRLTHILDKLDPGEKSDRPLAQARVSADGSFELAVENVSEGTDVWWMLRGRNLYLEQPRRSTVGSAVTTGIRLEPRSGTWLRGRLTPPESADASVSLAGVELELRTDGGQIVPAPRQREVSMRSELVTDADGRFEVRAVPAGASYVLSLTPDDFAAIRLDLKNFEPCATKDVEVPLQAGGSLSGRVTDAETGAPIAEAKVRASLVGQWFGFDDFVVRETETDSSGRFSLTAVTPGKVTVRAKATGKLDSGGLDTQVTEVGKVEDLSIELSNGASISGRTIGPDGRPLADVEINAGFDPAHMAGMEVFNALRGAESSARSGADGTFVVSGLGKGPFVVRATLAADFDEETGQGRRVSLKAYRSGVAPQTTGLELVLSPPLGLYGRVVDAEGEPLTSFKVVIERQVEAAFGVMGLDDRKESFDDDDGLFLVEDIDPGRWKLHAAAKGYATVEPVIVDMPATSADDRVTVTLVPASSVAGIVLSPTNEPVPEATIRVDTGTPGWQEQMSGGPDGPTARTDDEGRFLIEGLTPGKVGLRAEADGHARGPTEALELAPGELVSDVTLRLTYGGTLTGEVYDAAGDPGAGFLITLNNLDTFDTNVVVADDRGEFLFEHLEPAGYQVIGMDRNANYRGNDDEEGFDMGEMLGSMKMSQATIKEGETTHVVLGAPPADPVVVSGKVSHGDEPYAGAMVSFYPEGGGIYERMKFTTVDKEGRYELTIDGPGDYVVNVQKISGAPGQQNTIEFARAIPAGTEHRLDFEIPLGRISGRVLGEDGKPVVGARVSLGLDVPGRSDSLFGGQYTEMETAEDGTFDIEGLRPSTYRLSVGGASFMNLAGEARFGRVTRGGLTVGDNEWLQNIELRVPTPGTLEVNVRDTDGKPVKNASVFLRDEGGRMLEIFSLNSTDGTGTCVYSGLAPGEYTALARAGSGASQESTPVRVASGDTKKLDLRLETGTVLWIKLVGGDGEGVRASVEVTDSDGREMGGMFSMADLQALYVEGSFSPTEHRLGPLPAGRYRVKARTAEGLETTKPVTLRGEPERKLTVRLKD